MKITIEIPSPPKGYSVPERRSVYLPFDNTLILIGDTWVLGTDYFTVGGTKRICCFKIKEENSNEQEEIL